MRREQGYNVRRPSQKPDFKGFLVPLCEHSNGIALQRRAGTARAVAGPAPRPPYGGAIAISAMRRPARPKSP